MTFIKGSKIEVFSKREVSTGSWRPAEIISGTILKELGRKQVLVELHGSLVNLIVSMDEIRFRHSWEDDKWIRMGKRSTNCEDGKHYDMQAGFTHKFKNNSPHCPTECEYSEGAVRKYRRLEKEGQSNRAMENASGEHAYIRPSQCEVDGKKRGRLSLIIRFPVIAQRNEPNHSVDRLSSASSDSNDEDTDLCSIGSCSTTDSWRECNHYGPASDRNEGLSDVESHCGPSYDEQDMIIESLEKAAVARIHQLELQGYRCTLRAFYASGPLSWEQQSLISNLRLSLNISNDEHLMELKSLLSS